MIVFAITRLGRHIARVPHAVLRFLPATFGVALIVFARLFGLGEKEVGALPAMLSAGGLRLSVIVLITSRVVEHFRSRHKHMKACDADAEFRAYGVANCLVGAFGAPLRSRE